MIELNTTKYFLAYVFRLNLLFLKETFEHYQSFFYYLNIVYIADLPWPDLNR